jgi:hypothetical protein
MVLYYRDKEVVGVFIAFLPLHSAFINQQTPQCMIRYMKTLRKTKPCMTQRKATGY